MTLCWESSHPAFEHLFYFVPCHQERANAPRWNVPVVLKDSLQQTNPAPAPCFFHPHLYSPLLLFWIAFSVFPSNIASPTQHEDSAFLQCSPASSGQRSLCIVREASGALRPAGKLLRSKCLKTGSSRNPPAPGPTPVLLAPSAQPKTPSSTASNHWQYQVLPFQPPWGACNIPEANGHYTMYTLPLCCCLPWQCDHSLHHLAGPPPPSQECLRGVSEGRTQDKHTKMPPDADQGLVPEL